MATVGRTIPLLGLIALAPVGAYAIGRGELRVALSVGCVLLIVASLVGMFGDTDQRAGPTGH